METKDDLLIIGVDECGGCCQTGEVLTDGQGDTYGCHEKRTVLTHREEEVLTQIRELSLRARAVKEQLSRLDTTEEAGQAVGRRLAEELATLRQRRSLLEAERIAAAEERMRLLGHA